MDLQEIQNSLPINWNAFTEQEEDIVAKEKL